MKRLEILQKWIVADQELEAANAKQIQAKHEISILVAEQTAENAKTVHQGNPGFQNHTSGSISDQPAQQTVLSVFKSVRSLNANHSVPRCFGTDSAETGNRGPEAHSLPCEVVGSDEELVKRHHRKEAIGGKNANRKGRFVACSVSGSGPNSLQCPFILRFPELVKRITQDLHKPQRSCRSWRMETNGQRAFRERIPS